MSANIGLRSGSLASRPRRRRPTALVAPRPAPRRHHCRHPLARLRWDLHAAPAATPATSSPARPVGRLEPPYTRDANTLTWESGPPRPALAANLPGRPGRPALAPEQRRQRPTLPQSGFLAANSIRPISCGELRGSCAAIGRPRPAPPSLHVLYLGPPPPPGHAGAGLGCGAPNRSVNNQPLSSNSVPGHACHGLPWLANPRTLPARRLATPGNAPTPDPARDPQRPGRPRRGGAQAY